MRVDHDFMVTIQNAEVLNSFVKAEREIDRHSRILCSVSGGADSDIVVDMLTKLDDDRQVVYVWFDTGMEYSATKEQLDYLESRYNITIRREKAIKPIPSSCKEFGQPFLSKYVSEMIERLQRHDFKWEDESYSKLLPKYPNAKSALKWWCSWHDEDLAEHFPSQSGKSSKWSISRNRYLREFMIENPPQFKVSAKCCSYAKKDLSFKIEREINADLVVTGIRKAEGGARAGAYTTCTSFDAKRGIDTFRPLFWYTHSDKEYYEQRFEIQHSRCYTEYGLKRTGCVGCPFGRKICDELSVIKHYEPQLYAACSNVFKDSYLYTEQYRKYVKEQKARR